MRDKDFKEKMMKKAEEVIDLLDKNGKRYGDDMLNLFQEDYPLMHITAKALRVKNMVRNNHYNPGREDQKIIETIKEESRDILGYAFLLIAIEEGLIT